jgi:hypothetical protein
MSRAIPPPKTLYLYCGVSMSKLLRGVAAGYGSRKLTGGCGCMGIIVFIILWYILGHFGIFK